MAQSGKTIELVSINQYVDSVANPHGLLRTLGEVSPERDLYGDVKLRSGNNAVVFKVEREGEEKPLMMKCYIKNRMHADQIYDFIATHDDHLLIPAKLLRDEIYVYDLSGEGEYHDIVIAQWVEGNTLETEINRAAREFGAERFEELSRSFEQLAIELLKREWAHGDLKPENIIVRPDDSMVLIDYDAMFIPALAGKSTLEIGTPTYQHPRRNNNMFDKHIDDYSIAMIAVSLRALALDETLYNRYNGSDNIILYPDQILSGKSVAFDEVLHLLATHGDHKAYSLALHLKSSTPNIPKLDVQVQILTTPCATPPDDTSLSMIEHKGLWGYQSEDEEYNIPSIYSSATEFSQGLAVVELGGRQQVIDRSGVVVINNKLFTAIKPFSCGLATVETDGKWGYIDQRGELVIQPKFDAAGTMHEYLAPVKAEGKWGYIDSKGNSVIDNIYDHAMGFRNGKAIVHIGQSTLLIDHRGDILEGNT